MKSSLKHVAIIMDGNRRWATQKGLPKFMGHTEGAQNLEKIAQQAIDHDILYLTVYALSTENLKNRSRIELKHLFKLIEQFAKRFPEYEKHGIRIHTIGDLNALPKETQAILSDLKKKTEHFKNLTLTLAINYGGKDEIIRAVQKIQKQKIKITSEEEFEIFLDTALLPEVDLVIRTGGDVRLSNFLLWQSAYAELYFTKVYWPAFSQKDFQKALDTFYSAKRNKGK
ncbi:MAG: di-trans,poly-cis-decaprenylcistransferase [Candidatus Magasanikbacteria bacterium CG11_big_fil_rev_8_21_14_0_20_39_34]|uniref:Isoprenyl transferase n=1 Tax=Candidatus Magasanikbacteria bacterium CG11_big_fil_rev_8_21_14_0_20_39_34 TaxID=1974653 RepID=A0A2H0N6E8_9BACT|nr:MAG: di-trans,poly-cis-decaprenylcistransferase [Candidatus Magasanikbacteria bacterium CG11_big_fil_rev_8_21_14_0_20_39_34]